MKVLIQDTEPSRLAAWLTQMTRPGRVCHLANTPEQARFMLRDPYDLVLLEVAAPGGDADATELAELARQSNPACKVLDLPEHVGLDALEAAPAKSAPADPDGPGVRWRRIGAPSTKVVQEGTVTWRSCRSRRLVPAEPMVAQAEPAVADSAMPEHPPVPMPPPRLHLRPGRPDPALSIGQALRQRIGMAAHA